MRSGFLGGSALSFVCFFSVGVVWCWLLFWVFKVMCLRFFFLVFSSRGCLRLVGFVSCRCACVLCVSFLWWVVFGIFLGFIC